MNKSISVITPVFNGEIYLSEVIESVISQTGVDVTYLIVDDGSTDSTGVVAQNWHDKFPNQIRILKKENGGEASAVNYGFQFVETEYVVIVNSDDPLLPNHLAKTIEALENSPTSVVAYPDWKMIDEDGKTIRTVKTLEYSRKALIADMVCIPGPGAVFRLSALRGELPRDSRYRYVSDYVLWLKLSAVGPFIRIPETLATWRNHSLGATATGGGRKITGELIEIAENQLNELSQTDLPKYWIRHAKAKAYYYAAISSLDDSTIHGRRLLLKSFLLKPYPNFGYQTHHRSAAGVSAVLLGQIGRICVRFFRRRLFESS